MTDAAIGSSAVAKTFPKPIFLFFNTNDPPEGRLNNLCFSTAIVSLVNELYK